jgi:hypothetical protein
MLSLGNLPSGNGSQSRSESLDEQLTSIRRLKEWRDAYGHSEMTEEQITDKLYRFTVKGVVVAEVRRYGKYWLLTKDRLAGSPDFERAPA